MKFSIVVFPGSNCDRDLAVAIAAVTGRAPAMVWHRDTELPDNVGLIGIPGGAVGMRRGEHGERAGVEAPPELPQHRLDPAHLGGEVVGDEQVGHGVGAAS